MIRDVVYMLKPACPFDFEELRYSLRSLVNLPHGNVWIVGGHPSWMSHLVHHKFIRQAGVNKFTGAGRTFVASAGLPVSDEFYLFHDDMYVMRPVAEVPRLHRCSWEEWVSGRGTAHGTRWAIQTSRLMKLLNVPMVYSYEVHVPMVMNRELFREFLAKVREATQLHPTSVMSSVCKRSAYGNFVDYGGHRVQVDPKLRASRQFVTGQFLSSSGDRVPEVVREAFPDPCRYEESSRSQRYPLDA